MLLESLDVQELKLGTQTQALVPNPWLPESQQPDLEKHQEQGKAAALKCGLTRGEVFLTAGEVSLHSVGVQVMGCSPRTLTSYSQGAQRQAQVVQCRIVGFKGLFKKREIFKSPQTITYRFYQQ